MSGASITASTQYMYTLMTWVVYILFNLLIFTQSKTKKMSWDRPFWCFWWHGVWSSLKKAILDTQMVSMGWNNTIIILKSPTFSDFEPWAVWIKLTWLTNFDVEVKGERELFQWVSLQSDSDEYEFMEVWYPLECVHFSDAF